MITFLRALGMVCLATWLLEARRLDKGSTTQTWAHLQGYTAPKLLKEVNRRLEPWPSTRVMVPSRWIEHLSSGYKSEVIAIILRRHIYWAGSQLLPNIHDCNLLGLLQEPSMPAMGFEPTQHQSLAYGAGGEYRSPLDFHPALV